MNLEGGSRWFPFSRERGQILPRGRSRSIIIPLSFAPGWRPFGPAVIRVRTAKSAVPGNYLRDALVESSHAAIVNKCATAPIRACAPRALVGSAGANVEQHCRCYGSHDEHESH